MNFKTLGLNTFLRIINLKSFYLIVGVTLAIVLFSPAKSTPFLIAFIPMILVILVGCREISHEIHTKMLDTILAKPVSRESFIIGKFTGVFSVGVLLTLILSISGAIAGGYLGSVVYWEAVYLAVMMNFSIGAIAIFLSVVAPEITALIFSIGILALGHFTYLLPVMLNKIGGGAMIVGMGIFYSLPNLDHFYMDGHVLDGEVLPLDQLLWITLYTVAYGFMVLMITAICFKKRDIN